MGEPIDAESVPVADSKGVNNGQIAWMTGAKESIFDAGQYRLAGDHACSIAGHRDRVAVSDQPRGCIRIDQFRMTHSIRVPRESVKRGSDRRLPTP